MRRSVTALLVGCTTVAAACGGDGEQPTAPPPGDDPSPEPTAVEVSPDSAGLTALGATRDFDAMASDPDGDPVAGLTFAWSLSPDSVGTVDEAGTVTAESNGSASVVASTSGIADTAVLTVEQEVSNVRVSPDSSRSRVIGERVQFDATAVDRNDHPVPARQFAWSSSDTTVTMVTDDGLATTKGEGSASITAAVADVEGSARLVVRLPPDRLVQEFAGPSDDFQPARPDVAASPRRVIVVLNGYHLTLYSTSGTELDAGNVNTVFGDRARAGTKTRVVFDHDSGRFFVVGGTGPASEDEPGQFLLMVSRTPNPSDFSGEDWHAFVIDADPEVATFDEAHPARPRVGVARDAVVLESFMAESQGPGDPCFTRLVILDKEEILDGTITDKTELDVGKAPDQYCPDLVPVKSSSGSPLFVNSQGGLEVWGIEDPLGEPSLERTEVTGAPGAFSGRRPPPDAPQPDTEQELINFRGVTAQPIRAGTDVWAAGTERVETDAGGRSGVRWVQLDVSAWPADVGVRKTGVFSSEHHAVYPAIAGDADGDFAVVYGRSSETEYPSLYYRYGDGSWPGDSISGPQLLKAGEASLTIGGGRVKYGDWFGASLDPADRSAWLVGEYVVGQETWGTWVGKVGF